MPFDFLWHCLSFSQQCHLSVLLAWIYLGDHVNDMYVYYLFLLFIFFFPGLYMKLQQHCLQSLVPGPILFKIKGKIMLGNGVSPERILACCPDIAKNQLLLKLLCICWFSHLGWEEDALNAEAFTNLRGQVVSFWEIIGVYIYHQCRRPDLPGVSLHSSSSCEFTQHLECPPMALWKRSCYFCGTIIQGHKHDSHARNFTALLCCVTSMSSYHPETPVKTQGYH